MNSAWCVRLCFFMAANCGSNAFQIAQSVCVNTCVSGISQDHGTFDLQTHDRGHSRIKKILHAEEHILERIEEEPHIITCRFAAEVGVSQFVVHRTLKEQGHIHIMFKKCEVSSPLIVHVV
ncbi:hypothetical protein Zmor_005453 [Zophobas morio]|uniref:Uncharacterized protein n=1 Tax=Zophobas morio TaxID=2755281 RepID=A0AA38IW11_9CUCU|nr:hypothetical protein Zmor_005453 [Zophobas morio]